MAGRGFVQVRHRIRLSTRGIPSAISPGSLTSVPETPCIVLRKRLRRVRCLGQEPPAADGEDDEGLLASKGEVWMDVWQAGALPRARRRAARCRASPRMPGLPEAPAPADEDGAWRTQNRRGAAPNGATGGTSKGGWLRFEGQWTGTREVPPWKAGNKPGCPEVWPEMDR